MDVIAKLGMMKGNEKVEKYQYLAQEQRIPHKMIVTVVPICSVLGTVLKPLTSRLNEWEIRGRLGIVYMTRLQESMRIPRNLRTLAITKSLVNSYWYKADLFQRVFQWVEAPMKFFYSYGLKLCSMFSNLTLEVDFQFKKEENVVWNWVW